MDDLEKLENPSKVYSKVGKFEDPTVYNKIVGPCGDAMEFYLNIENDNIKSIRFLTTGCYFTVLCGNAVACEAEGKRVLKALEINPGQILSKLKNKLPLHHYHCSILAVSTLYKAIAEYLLAKNNDLLISEEKDIRE